MLLKNILLLDLQCSNQQPLGCCTIPVLAGGHFFVTFFTVRKGCVADIIFGWDSLTSLRALIDCANSELHLDRFHFKDDSSSASKIVLLLAKDSVLAPHSTSAVALFTEERLTELGRLIMV